MIDALANAAGEDVVERVSPAPRFAGAAVVERLLGELDRLQEPLDLVIDDLHELASDDALAWLEMLVTRLPAGLRVVLATREEPALGLHRLRLAGELAELRAPDLRFSLDETRALLDAERDQRCRNAGCESVHERTEGWPAGVRLAAISLATHPDPERFVAEFSGSERTVAGYLLAEVLDRQPPEVRELLLRTSILERVSGSLADALTGGAGAEAILQRLEAQNAFVTALDAARTWFRYHHLFADLLRLELRRVAPARSRRCTAPRPRGTSSIGTSSKPSATISPPETWAPAARLLVDNYLALTMDGRGETLHALLGSSRPMPIWATSRGRARDRLHPQRPARRGRRPPARRPAPRGGGAGGETARLRRLPGRHRGRAGPPAPRSAQGPGGPAELEAALGATRDEGLPVRAEYRALTLMNLGIAELWAGRVEDARQHLEDALGRTPRSSRPFIEVGCLAHLALAALLTGQPLPLALELSERALAIAEEHGWAGQSMTTGAFATAGTVLVRRGASPKPSATSRARRKRCARRPTREPRSCSGTPAA